MSTEINAQKKINEYMKLRKRGNVRTAGKVDKNNNRAKKTAKLPHKCSTEIPRPVTTRDKEKDLEELRKFDLDPRFGPSLDASRSERWNRAEKLGLNPSQHIKTLIESFPDDIQYSHSVWQGVKLLSVPTIYES